MCLYLCNTDEDDEDGGRAAVGPLQVLAASVFRQHPSGDELLELLAAAHLPVAVGSVRSRPERFAVAVHGERLLLLEVDLLHRCSEPSTEKPNQTVDQMHLICFISKNTPEQWARSKLTTIKTNILMDYPAFKKKRKRWESQQDITEYYSLMQY